MEIIWKYINSDLLIKSPNLKFEDTKLDYKLSQFIKKLGVVKNLVVFENDAGKYEIIDGNRVFDEAVKLGITEFKCCIIPKDNPAYNRTMLNTLIYKNDLVELSDLINTLTPEQLDKLPFTSKMIETFKTLLEFDWKMYHKTKTDQDQGKLF